MDDSDDDGLVMIVPKPEARQEPPPRGYIGDRLVSDSCTCLAKPPKKAAQDREASPRSTSPPNYHEPGLATRKRELLRPWLVAQIERGDIDGLEWLDSEKQMFKIPWRHRSLVCYKEDSDAILFERWAIHTSRYKPGKEEFDPKKAKANFRCALNSRQDIKQVPGLGKKAGCSAFRVFRLLPSNPSKSTLLEERRNAEKAKKNGVRGPITTYLHLPVENVNLSSNEHDLMDASSLEAAETLARFAQAHREHDCSDHVRWGKMKTSQSPGKTCVELVEQKFTDEEGLAWEVVNVKEEDLNDDLPGVPLDLSAVNGPSRGYTGKMPMFHKSPTQKKSHSTPTKVLGQAIQVPNLSAVLLQQPSGDPHETDDEPEDLCSQSAELSVKQEPPSSPPPVAASSSAINLSLKSDDEAAGPKPIIVQPREDSVDEQPDQMKVIVVEPREDPAVTEAGRTHEKSPSISSPELRISDVVSLSQAPTAGSGPIPVSLPGAAILTGRPDQQPAMAIITLPSGQRGVVVLKDKLAEAVRQLGGDNDAQPSIVPGQPSIVPGIVPGQPSIVQGPSASLKPPLLLGSMATPQQGPVMMASARTMPQAPMLLAGSGAGQQPPLVVGAGETIPLGSAGGQSLNLLLPSASQTTSVLPTAGASPQPSTLLLPGGIRVTELPGLPQIKSPSAAIPTSPAKAIPLQAGRGGLLPMAIPQLVGQPAVSGLPLSAGVNVVPGTQAQTVQPAVGLAQSSASATVTKRTVKSGSFHTEGEYPKILPKQPPALNYTLNASSGAPMLHVPKKAMIRLSLPSSQAVAPEPPKYVSTQPGLAERMVTPSKPLSNSTSATTFSLSPSITTIASTCATELGAPKSSSSEATTSAAADSTSELSANSVAHPLMLSTLRALNTTSVQSIPTGVAPKIVASLTCVPAAMTSTFTTAASTLPQTTLATAPPGLTQTGVPTSSMSLSTVFQKLSEDCSPSVPLVPSTVGALTTNTQPTTGTSSEVSGGMQQPNSNLVSSPGTKLLIAPNGMVQVLRFNSPKPDGSSGAATQPTSSSITWTIPRPSVPTDTAANSGVTLPQKNNDCKDSPEESQKEPSPGSSGVLVSSGRKRKRTWKEKGRSAGIGMFSELMVNGTNRRFLNLWQQSLEVVGRMGQKLEAGQPTTHMDGDTAKRMSEPFSAKQASRSAWVKDFVKKLKESETTSPADESTTASSAGKGSRWIFESSSESSGDEGPDSDPAVKKKRYNSDQSNGGLTRTSEQATDDSNSGDQVDMWSILLEDVWSLPDIRQSMEEMQVETGASLDEVLVNAYSMALKTLPKGDGQSVLKAMEATIQKCLIPVAVDIKRHLNELHWRIRALEKAQQKSTPRSSPIPTPSSDSSDASDSDEEIVISG